MRNIIEKIKSKKDVILCRGIWYVTTLLSIFVLSISLNFFWPPRECLSLSSRFLRDGAVSITTFYGVMLLRSFFFTDPPSTYYRDREFTTSHRAGQTLITEIAIFLVVLLPTLLTLWKVKHTVWFSFFTTSFFTGALGLIQLSEKFQMEMKHALMTLFTLYFHGFYVVFTISYPEKYEPLWLALLTICIILQAFIICYDYRDKFMDECFDF